MSVGINKHIDFAITLLQNELWTGYNNSYNGRSFRLKKSNRTMPEIYIGSGETKEVFQDDNYHSIIHFDLDPTRNIIGKRQATAGVNIIIAVNVGTIYGTSTRAVEEAHNAVISVINNTAFQISDIVTDIDALSDYDLTTDEEDKFNMQPYYVFKLECTCSYALNTVCTPITPSQYTLTMQAGDNGSVEPTAGTYTKNVNQVVPIKATADAGFQFAQWLINGVADLASLTYVVMNENITAIAQFVVSTIKQLIIAVSGTGTTSPVPGTYPTEAGTVVPITAVETDELFYHEKFTVDGIDDLNNPITPTINENTSVVAYFLEYSQWVFDQGIETVLGLHYFLDLTSNLNKVQIKKTQISNFIGNSFVTVGAHDTTQYGFQYETGIVIYNFLDETYIIGRTSLGISLRTVGICRVFINGINRQISFDPLTIGAYYIIKVTYDSRLVSDNLKIYANNVLLGTLNVTDILLNPQNIFGIGSQTGTSYNQGFFGLMSHAKLSNVDGNVIFNYYFQEGQGIIIYDQSDNNNQGTVIGANLLVFWGSKSEFAYPALLIYGYERYESEITPGDYIDVIFANGLPQSPIIAGYSLKETIQPNAGFSDTGNTLDGLQITGLETDATFTEVFALETTADYVITKTATEVTQLKIK